MCLKKLITHEITHNRGRVKFCSQKCNNYFNNKNLSQTIQCHECKNSLVKQLKEIKKSKNHFCSRSCNAKYNNKNKSFGTRRSKLEKWLEDQLNILYPDLNIKYNTKEAIGSELDICIPELNIAFELNGIFHYEPIYGEDKLSQIKENDISKSKACHDKKIDLCVIDTSSQKRFTEKSSQKYLVIIINIINKHIKLSPI